jgi:hypothetical protein
MIELGAQRDSVRCSHHLVADFGAAAFCASMEIVASSLCAISDDGGWAKQGK